MNEALKTLFAGAIAAAVFFGGIVLFVHMTEGGGITKAAAKVDEIRDPVRKSVSNAIPSVPTNYMSPMSHDTQTNQSSTSIDESEIDTIVRNAFGEAVGLSPNQINNMSDDDCECQALFSLVR